jgi:putative addiction module component (TIGR02574 family)
MMFLNVALQFWRDVSCLVVPGLTNQVRHAPRLRRLPPHGQSPFRSCLRQVLNIDWLHLVYCPPVDSHFRTGDLRSISLRPCRAGGLTMATRSRPPAEPKRSALHVSELVCRAESVTLEGGGMTMPIELPLSTMSVGEKVQLLEQLWDDLCRQPGEVRSPEWHAAILKERQRQIENGTMSVSPWSEAKERLQKLGK